MPSNNLKNSFYVSKIDDINLKNFDFKLKEYKNKVKKALETILNLKELKQSKIFDKNINKIRFDISFCKNLTIKDINSKYRNKNTETDVITFALFVDDDNAFIYRKTADLGQIIISLEKTDNQKDKNKNTFEKEILTLTIHGILHLMGFDHLTKKDYDFVVGIQEKVLNRIYE